MTQHVTKNIEDEMDTVDSAVYDSQDSNMQLELLSHEINDIISHQPHWIIRYGAAIIGIMLVISVSVSWFIHYPDTHFATVTIGQNPKTGLLYCQITLPDAEVAQLNPTKPVLIELENHPPATFGYVQGTINLIPPPSFLNRDKTIINITLSEDLRTTKGKTIPFRGNAKGKAKLFKHDRRLLEKLFWSIIRPVKD